MEYINSLEELMNAKDKLYKQYVEFLKSSYIKENDKKIEQLFNAIYISIPSFNIEQILDYRLSWLELTILNNLSAAYSDSSTPSIGIQYFYNILQYLDFNNIDILFRKSISGITTMLLFKHLYSQKRYSEMLEKKYLLSFSASCISHDTVTLSNVYAHFCQALGECGYIEELVINAHYSLACYKLYENNEKIALIQKFIKEDFNIDIS